MNIQTVKAYKSRDFCVRLTDKEQVYRKNNTSKTEIL
jgi:hypothetical protein